MKWEGKTTLPAHPLYFSSVPEELREAKGSNSISSRFQTHEKGQQKVWQDKNVQVTSVRPDLSLLNEVI